jgi:tRNA methyl transferase
LPFYVCGKNMQTNEVFVTTDINNGELWAKEINVSALHWINEKTEDGAEIQVRIRHRAPLVNAKIFFENDGTAKIKLTDEQRAITSGQSVVFYSGEVCLGGGIVI